MLLSIGLEPKARFDKVGAESLVEPRFFSQLGWARKKSAPFYSSQARALSLDSRVGSTWLINIPRDSNSLFLHKFVKELDINVEPLLLYKVDDPS